MASLMVKQQAGLMGVVLEESRQFNDLALCPTLSKILS